MSRLRSITDEQTLAPLDRAVEQVRLNLPLYAGKCQNHSSVDGIYPACENDQWTCGFWPGEIWLACERTGEDAFRRAGPAREMAGSLAERYAAPLRPGGGLILHGTYSKKSPYNTCVPEGVDECVSWGDYFYMEALTRLAGDWDPYW